MLIIYYLINEISFELQIEIIFMLIIFAVTVLLMSSSKRCESEFRPVRDSNPDLCDAGAVLYQLPIRPTGSWSFCRSVDHYS